MSPTMTATLGWSVRATAMRGSVWTRTSARTPGLSRPPPPTVETSPPVRTASGATPVTA